MTGILLLIPVALILGGVGVAAFFWSLRNGQYDDLEGAAHRVLLDDDDPPPQASDAASLSEDVAVADPGGKTEKREEEDKA